MKILSLHIGGHDGTAAVYEDYDILSAIQKERVTRKKGDGRGDPSPQVEEALKIANMAHTDIEQLVISNGALPFHFLQLPLHREIRHKIERLFGKTKYYSSQKFPIKKSKYSDLLEMLGLSKDADVFLCNHHYAHALSAFAYTDWDDSALLYTYDGIGDSVFHSAYHFDGKDINCLEGGADDGFEKNIVGSLAFAYAYCTEAIGFKPNRHEGKLTGLAAYGEPVLYDKIAEKFYVDDSGMTRSHFRNKEQMRSFFHSISQGERREDVAASIQKILEDYILKSVQIYIKKTGARKLGVAGGVFANVRLNAHLKDNLDLDEIFIFPGMGDEGIAVGGAMQFLLERDGIQEFLANRKRLSNVYFGYDYNQEIDEHFIASGDVDVIEGTPAIKCAELLIEGRVGAIYNGRMEYGPRALGARTILANPSDPAVNDAINKRLNRTEFMPFAPYVLVEDAEDVFEVDDVNRYACNFMTITTKVKESWKDKIAAVVHVDGTARPQIINRKDNELYYDILKEFKDRTGIPALVNTSFNAHEEPIINTPHECLTALLNDRVDFIVTTKAVYKKKSSK